MRTTQRAPEQRLAEPQLLVTGPWLGGTFRVFFTRLWIWLPLLIVLQLPDGPWPASELAVLQILPLSADGLPSNPHAILAFLRDVIPAAGAMWIAALLVPRALPTIRARARIRWGQAVRGLPSVFLVVGLLFLPSKLPYGAVFGQSAALGMVVLLLAVVLQVRASLAPVLVVSRGVGPLAALRWSFRLTRGNTLVLTAGYALLAAIGAMYWWGTVLAAGGFARDVPAGTWGFFAGVVMHGARLTLFACAVSVAVRHITAPAPQEEADATADVFA